MALDIDGWVNVWKAAPKSVLACSTVVVNDIQSSLGDALTIVRPFCWAKEVTAASEQKKVERKI